MAYSKSKLRRMSTEQLEEILSSNLREETPALGGDAVLSILDVLEEQSVSKGDDPADVLGMWERFRRDYLPDAEEGSLYGEEAVSPAASTAPKKRRKFLRVASIAVAAVLAVGAVTATAQAAGYDLWNVIATWGEDHFSFMSTSEDWTMPSIAPAPPLMQTFRGKTPQETLALYGIYSDLAPTRLPERYRLVSTEVYDQARHVDFSAVYHTSRGMTPSTFTWNVRQHLTDPDFSVYKKGENDPEVYTAGGIDHYIMSDIGEGYLRAAWVTDNFECYISGYVTLEEMHDIIDSIYE